ncbi:MAG: hypothetical protein ABJO09_01395 [Hyphomicrobiales bacterium]
MEDGYQRFVTLLEKSETFDKERLLTLQHKGLTRFLRHAWEQVPAYKDRLRPLFAGGENPDFSKWHDVPILTRPEVQSESRELRAKNVPRQAGDTETKHTSGSTGTPMIHHRSTLQKLANQATWDRILRWNNIDPGKRLARLTTNYADTASYPNGLKTMEWCRGYPNGESFELDNLSTNLSQQLEFLIRHPSEYLIAFPNNALGLIEEARQNGSKLPRYEALLVSGEVLDTETRQTLLENLADKVINLYGASETGRLAADCPQHNHLHVHEEITFLEVVDDNGMPVEDGQIGRIVTTSFYNFAMPLVRYASGDYGTLIDCPCPCGRSSRALKSVAGRQRNLFHFIDGTSKWPNVKMKELRPIYPFKQLQVIQDQLDHLTLYMVPSEQEMAIDKNAIQEVFRRSLHPTLNISIELRDEIKRVGRGKFEDFISKVSNRH